MFSEAHLTKSQYTKFRSQAKIKNCDVYPSFHVNKTVTGEWYLPKGKVHNYKSLVEVHLQVLVDRTASRIIMAQKMPQILFWTTFLKNFPSFQNGFAMEALDTANTNNGHWKMLVTVIFLSHLWFHYKLYSTKTPGDKFILWHNRDACCEVMSSHPDAG